MKIILYIRKGRAGHCTMHTRIEEEPSCDNPRVLNIGREIRDQLDRMIDNCNRLGTRCLGYTPHTTESRKALEEALAAKHTQKGETK